MKKSSITQKILTAGITILTVGMLTACGAEATQPEDTAVDVNNAEGMSGSSQNNTVGSGSNSDIDTSHFDNYTNEVGPTDKFEFEEFVGSWCNYDDAVCFMIHADYTWSRINLSDGSIAAEGIATVNEYEGYIELTANGSDSKYNTLYQTEGYLTDENERPYYYDSDPLGLEAMNYTGVQDGIYYAEDASNELTKIIVKRGSYYILTRDSKNNKFEQTEWGDIFFNTETGNYEAYPAEGDGVHIITNVEAGSIYWDDVCVIWHEI